MQIERRFVRDGKMAQQVHDGIVATAPLAERLGSDHPDVLTALGKLYADTVSNLRPKVMVQGNPTYLGQADKIGRAPVRTPVTNAHIVCRLLLAKQTNYNK